MIDAITISISGIDSYAIIGDLKYEEFNGDSEDIAFASAVAAALF